MQQAAKLYFEDLRIGQTFEGAAVRVDRAAMLDFARAYDPQLMHIDGSAARALGFRDIIAAGSYTHSLAAKSLGPIWARMHFLPSEVAFQMKFVLAVYASDVLRVQATVKAKRPSPEAGRGVLQMVCAFVNQDGRSVLDIESIWLVRTNPFPDRD
ncbi:MAG: MaoC/PaaZ C-terminal domain-containing protein [Alphaproteobacteria bacterium]